MDVLLSRCAALDVHKAMVQACRITPDASGKPVAEQRKFTTFTADLLALRDWLAQAQVTHVALESTGSYWRPIYNVLEGHFELLLVNPHNAATSATGFVAAIGALSGIFLGPIAPSVCACD